MADNTSTETNQTGNKFKRFITSRKGDLIVLTLLSALALLFTLIFYSIKFTELEGFATGRDELSFWTADAFYIESGRVLNFNIYMTVAFVVGIALYAVAELVLFVKNRNRLFYLAAIYTVGLSLVCLILGITLKFMSGGAMVCCVVSTFFAMAALGYLIARRHATAPAETNADGSEAPSVEPENNAPLTSKQKRFKFGLFICECVELIILITVMFIPLYTDGATGTTYVLISSLFANDYPIFISVAFVVMVVAIFGEILFFISTISDYFGSRVFVIRSRRFVLSTTVFTLLFFLIGYCLTFYNNIKGEATTHAGLAYTVSYIPFILAVATMIVYSVLCGKLPVGVKGSHNHLQKPFKIEPLIAVVVITAITFLSLVLNVIEISVKISVTSFKREVAFNGYELLSTYKNLESGFQLLAFVEFAVLLSSGMLLVASLISFLAKDANHYKIIKAAAVANFLFVMMIGLFGIYFKIGQRINEENINSVLAYYEISLPDGYEYEVNSQTIYMLIASAGVMIYMLLRKIFSLGAKPLSPDMFDTTLSDAVNGTPEQAQPSAARSTEKPLTYDFDACPAFTELDQKQPQFNAALEERRKHLFTNLTLPNLVRFLVDYARECRIHLSYTPEDIATFVAGLGASRLAILQGMSGTGKTSLPKMFTEAVMGNCEIVEVESSWRDKNELLGYYNEFSKCFTPKKFTQCLYKARLNSSVLTFIVLDEMNLSRIEYYFSDFLSLMENEEDKREIKLLNVKLYRTENGKRYTYDGLTDGHTIKIPTNVWFIGTANRDESTFEISDKVYDRAQTMNFNKRAPKITSFSEPLEQRFMSYDMLLQLFDRAKKEYAFDAESNTLIQKTERLLAPYNISFGNRILRQIEDFVKIYCACFGDRSAVESDAVEKILLSKVLRKLESKVVENKEKLAAEFDKIGLKQCSEFVRRLNED